MLNKIPIIKFQIPKILIGICFLLFDISAYSQCAMCRASLISEGNNTKAEALNDGIVYLMAIPYVLVGVVGFMVYKMFFKKKKS